MAQLLAPGFASLNAYAPSAGRSRLSSVRVHAAATGGGSGGSGGMRQLSPQSSSTPAPSTATATSSSAASSSPAPLTPSTPATPARTSYRVSFFEAMRFNGPAPELINGRLAMVGLLAAAVHEAETGQTVLHQLNHVSLGTCLALGVWVYASLVPVMKGVKQEAFGPFSPRAELTNGRAAMLGFAVLVGLESVAGVPFF